nr:sedoheptulokinase isoform X4 [Caretta caretta]
MMADNQAIGLSPCATPGTVCVLGIDLGTTSVKAALVVETAQGQIVTQSCSRETQAQANSPAAGAQGMEQDVQKIIKALNECLAAFPQEHLQRSLRCHQTPCCFCGYRLTRLPPDTRCCKWAESGTGHTFQPGEVSHLITWQDGRCSSSFLSSLPQPQSHLSVATGFGCATIYWYLKNSLRESGFPLDLLPEVGDPGGIAGRMPHDWHGIPKGAEVGIALGDFQCSVYSCMTERTDAVLNISTSAQLTVPMPLGFQPPETPDSLSAVAYFPYFDGNYLAVAASLNGGNVLATFVDMLACWMAELGYDVLESHVYTQMINAALAQNATRLSICPTVFGERHMPEQLASVTSIAASELSLGHVTRALCHGIIQNLHSMLPFQHLKEAGVKRILGSGSALSRNEVLKQEVEKTFPLPVIYGKDVDAAVGAAMVMLHRR